MRPIFLSLLLLTALPLAAQDGTTVLVRPLEIEADTPEALLLVRISEEADPAKKMVLLEQFAREYPKHEALVWVLDQVLTAQLRAGQTEAAIVTAERILAADPDNLAAAHACLKIVEDRKDPEQLHAWAARTSAMSERVAASKQPRPEEEREDWLKRVDFAREVRTYLEYAFFLAASQTKDYRAKLERIQDLERRYPGSKYSPQLRSQEFLALRGSGSTGEAAAAAERAIAAGHGTIEMYLLLASHHYQKSNDRCLHFTAKTIEMVQGGTRPEGLSEAEWSRKRAGVLAQCYYMLGITHASMEHWQQADRVLRTALGHVRGDQTMLAGTLFYLGYANLKLAEAGTDKTRVTDALKYSEQCANLRTNLQAAALKNVEALKSQYNLQ